MNAELFINGRLIDINESLPFPFTYNISDIKDLSVRKGNKSKTITLPGTRRNNELMQSVFITSTNQSINSGESTFLNFDPSVKSPCQYYENGLLVFNGIAQLLECKYNDGIWRFEISITSDTIDYIALMKQIKINELDFSEYDHECNITNQSLTWTGVNKINGVNTSIKTGADWNGDGYYYGLIDCGFTRVTANTFRVDQIAPQIFVYGILEKLFAHVGLTWESTFLETQLFKKLLMAYFGGNLPQIDATEAAFQSVITTENNNAITGTIANLYLATYQQLTGDLVNPYFYSFATPQFVADNIDVTVVTDPNTQTLTSSPFLFKSKSAGLFNITYAGDHDVQIITSNVITGFTYRGYINIFKNNVPLNQSEIYLGGVTSASPTQTQSFSFTTSLNLLENDELRFAFSCAVVDIINDELNSGDIQFSIESAGVDLKIEKQIQEFTPGSTIRINQFLPDLTGDVFFKGLITMFNLYLKPKTNDASIIEIEPLVDFYNSSNTALDWSELVDKSKEIKVIPTANFASEFYKFSFEDDGDYWNSEYKNEHNEQYGSFLFNTQNQFATTKTELKLPFAQKPLVEIAGTSLIMPRNYQVNFNEAAAPQIVPKKGKSFIVQLGELRTGTWKHRSGANVDTTRSTYPYVGHLDDIDTPNFDLNFGVPLEVFYTAASYTGNNLYAYHEQFIQEVVSRFGKQVSLFVMIDSAIVNQLDFKNLINIDGVVYRLQKIIDFDAGKEKSTQIELIRIISGDSPSVPVPETFFRITETGDFRELEDGVNLRITE